MGILKQLVPESLKRQVKMKRKIARVREAMRNISLSRLPSEAELDALSKAWANEGWSANPQYLREVAQFAMATTNPILDCGSGLTTLISAALAGRNGVPVHALEHTPVWADEVQATLDALDLPAKVHNAPLRNYGDFDWYTLPADLPKDIGLILCDGPPGTTKGGRVGLLPVAGKNFAPGAVILLDDVDREGEVDVAKSWAKDFGLEYEIKRKGSGQDYIVAKYNARNGSKNS